MTTDTATRGMREIIEEAEQDLRDRFSDYSDEFKDGPDGVISEIADSAVPIYHSTLLRLAADPCPVNIDPFLYDVELHLAGENECSPSKLLGIAVYEIVTEQLWELWRNELAQDDDVE